MPYCTDTCVYRQQEHLITHRFSRNLCKKSSVWFDVELDVIIMGLFDIKICKSEKIPCRQLWKLSRLFRISMWAEMVLCQSASVLHLWIVWDVSGTATISQSHVMRPLCSSDWIPLCVGTCLLGNLLNLVLSYWSTKLGPKVYIICLIRAWVFSAPTINKLRS